MGQLHPICYMRNHDHLMVSTISSGLIKKKKKKKIHYMIWFITIVHFRPDGNYGHIMPMQKTNLWHSCKKKFYCGGSSYKLLVQIMHISKIFFYVCVYNKYFLLYCMSISCTKLSFITLDKFLSILINFWLFLQSWKT